jgi:hypothetical protein
MTPLFLIQYVRVGANHTEVAIAAIDLASGQIQNNAILLLHQTTPKRLSLGFNILNCGDSFGSNDCECKITRKYGQFSSP